MNQAKTQPVVMSDFLGILENLDPQDEPTGAAQDQVNLTCASPGQLTVRGGMTPVLFDDED